MKIGSFMNTWSEYIFLLIKHFELSKQVFHKSRDQTWAIKSEIFSFQCLINALLKY